MGLKEHEIYQPFVAALVIGMKFSLQYYSSDQAQHVKTGVKDAEVQLREFTTITVTDGIAMGHEVTKSSY